MEIKETTANVCVLEPGDLTAYRFIFSQSDWQRKHEELTICLVGMGSNGCGAAFTFSTVAILGTWESIKKQRQLKDQLHNFIVSEIQYILPTEAKNLYTARAIIEGAARWLLWRADG